MSPKFKLTLWITTAKFAKMLNIPLPPVPASCAIIFDKNHEKVLALDLSYRNGFNLPGGMVNFGENLEEALIREVKEETNLEVKKLQYISSEKFISDNISHVSACFLTEVKNFDDIKSSTEGKVFWANPKEIYQKAAYKDVQTHLKNYFKF